MLLSTSNSNERIPEAPWAKIWSVAIVTIVFSVLIWNISWSLRGAYPAPKDTPQFWQQHRNVIKPNDKNVHILIGSSRILAGIDQDVFREELNVSPVQLGVNGLSSYSTLEHFANDVNFRGTIIAEISELGFSKEEYKERGLNLWTNFNERKYSWSAYIYHKQHFFSYVIATPNLGETIPEMLRNTFSSDGLKRNVNMQSDRSTPYYRKFIDKGRNLSIKKRNIREIQDLETDDQNYQEIFLESINKMEEFVIKINARGGKVIFVKFPISGELKIEDKKAFPREKFWNVFARQTAARTINFEDYPSLAKFTCIDGSHLAAEDMTEFTKNLIHIIYKSDFDSK
jgi:hypothetical protein